jgi:hypothetical protein
MATATSAASIQAFQQAAQQFLDELAVKHPRIGELQSWDDIVAAVVKSYVDLGMPMASLCNTKAFWAAFHGCVQDKTIKLPPATVTLTEETCRQISAKYPTVITKERQLTQRERNALSGVPERASGRATVADRLEADRKREDVHRDERESRQAKALQSEFNRALADASMLTGRSHSESASLRAEAKQKVLADVRFRGCIR